MFTCFVKYKVDLTKLEAFKKYAHAWIELIEKYGGTHHGYFIPPIEIDALPDASFSFPGLGKRGSDDTGVALFSFPDVETYEAYRKAVVDDEKCKAITAFFQEAKPFTSYERNFLKPIFSSETL
ncbi:MAG: NIPSNAP family protein [Gammaproteobacteria bacterium]|nr:NIPSNAP family protein [Gammaproteobacteria bacterium]